MLPCSHSPLYDALLSVQFVVSVDGAKSFFKATALEKKKGISVLCIYFSVCLWKIFLLKVESSIKWFLMLEENIMGLNAHKFT